MGSIRPLFTITVLALVGGYLYWKINEGPEHRPGMHRELEQSQSGVPPLAAAGGGATLAQDSSAPAWPPAASAAPPALALPPSTDASANKTVATADAKSGMPEVPAIPELPELPSTVNATPPVTTPAAVVGADTSKTAAENATTNDSGPKLGGGSLGSIPTLPGTLTDPTTNLTPAAPASSPSTPALGMSADPSNGFVPLGSQAGSTASPTTTPSASLPPVSVAQQSNALTNTVSPTSPAIASDDRYGSSSPPALPPTAVAPVTPIPPTAPSGGAAFAASWPAIQAALDHNDLKQAHQLLSKWHGDESLSPADSQKVETLLNQLAGTVIYSTDHRLEPARIVNPGETLETIAKEYNVPWQLLGKINGIASPDQVRPGQQLKVVRGPFSATVDLHRNQLTLDLDGRYAGSFAVTVPPGAAVSEGQWLVDQKLQGLPASAAPSAYSPAPAAANDCAIVLRNAAGATASTGGPLLMIASSSAASAPAPPPSVLRRKMPKILPISSRSARELLCGAKMCVVSCLRSVVSCWSQLSSGYEAC